MSSSDSDDEVPFTLYRDRPEWKDVVPVPQDDGPNPVVAICYSEKFKDVYDYMRAIWKSNEHSERALELTADAIKCNAANYSVWHFRRLLLDSLGKDLHEELEYVGKIIQKNSKNYQVWYHRGEILKRINDSKNELEFTRLILGEDAKNYHCWQHRQLVLNHFKLWHGEVDFTSELLKEDLRNNSAWNQRFYAIKNTTGFVKEVVEKEVGYTFAMIQKAPNNESAWNFLKGVLIEAGGLVLFPNLKDDFEDMLAKGCDSPYLLSFLVDFYGDSLERGTGNEKELASRAIELCAQLADDVDQIRQQYWNYEKRSIQIKYHPVEAAS